MKREYRPDSIEAELLDSLADALSSDELQVIYDDSDVYELLKESYPVGYSKIELDLVPGSIYMNVYKVDQNNNRNSKLEHIQKVAFFDEICTGQLLTGQVFYINDGLDFVLKGSLEAIRKILPKLLLPNGHLYFMATDGRWCISFTMEGDLIFGRSPNDGPKQNLL